jgi:VCBS repeat-containing protein
VSTRTAPHHVQMNYPRRAASSMLVLALAVVLALGAVGAMAPANAAAPAAADLECFGVTATIVGTPGDDVIRGTNGADVIVAGRGDDRIKGRGGDDLICGRSGDDEIRGGNGDDRVLGWRGDDLILGGSGNDRLLGGLKADKILGGSGDDVLNGGAATDECDGGPGVNHLVECEVTPNEAPIDLTLAPTAVSENQPAGAVVGSLTAADPDVGDTHAFTLVAGAGGGDNSSFSISGSSLRTAAVLDHEATPTRSIRVRATDSGGLFVEKQLTITVTDVDDPPVAVDDSKTVTEDAAAAAVDVLANDTDVDGGPMSIASVTPPAHGTVVITGGGTGLTYAPAPNYCNTPTPPFDTFTYTLAPGTSTATVSVTVTCVDDNPVAVDDSRTVGEDDPATAVDVLANDTDVDAGPKSIQSVTQPTHGSVVITGGGTGLTYAPAANYCNTPTPPFDTFTYTLAPGGSTATVSMTVSCVDDPPTAFNDSGTVAEDHAATAIPVLANDTDIDGGPTTIASTTQPANGTVAIIGGGAGLTYQPNANYCNSPPGTSPDSFNYTLNGGSSATVSMTVTCADDAPDAVDDTKTVLEDDPATAIDVLANDSDVENDPITITSATDPAHGTVVVTGPVGAGTGLTYAPDANYCNTPTPPFDTFTYTVNGGDTATVSVTVTCANDAPVVDLDSGTAGNDSAATFNETNPHTGTGVLIAPNATVTDIDDTTIESLTVVLTNRPDGDALESLSATIPGGSGITGGTYVPATGALSFTGSSSKTNYAALIASIRYDNTQALPNAANRTITVVVNDGDANSVVRNAVVTVVPLNAPPVNTVPGAQTTAEDTPLAFGAGNVLSVTDADNPSLTVEVQVTHGIFTLSGTAGLTVTGDGTADVTLSGTIANLNAALNGATYAPAPNYNGPAQLTITSTDSASASDTDNVAITVTPVNDGPTATNLSAAESYTEDTALNLINIVVSDIDSANVTATLTLSNPAAGSLSVGTSGTVTSTYVAGTGVWTASGAIADVNTLLAGVIFTPASNFNANFTIATSVSDGIAPPVTGSKAMTGTAVNDAPVNTVPGAQNVDEDTDLVFSGGSTISVSDLDAAPDAVQVKLTATNGTMTLSGIAGLAFTVGDGTADPTMTFSGNLTNVNAALAGLKYRGLLNFSGADTLSVDTSDLGHNPAPPQTDSDSVAITVNPVNDAPVADDETFNGAQSAVGNTTFVGDDPTDGAMATPDPTDTSPVTDRPHKTVIGDILAGDTDVDGPGPLTVTAGTFPTNDGGTVTIEADGDFTFEPVASTSCTDSSDFFDYTINDAGSPNQTDVGRVTIAIAGCVWYVNNDDAQGNNGTSEKPFNTLAQAETASGNNHYTFVYDGNNTTTGYDAGINLNSGERLIGEAASLIVGSDTLHSADAANRPTLTDNNADVVDLAAGNEVRGLELDPKGTGGGIFGNVGDAGGTIDDVRIIDTGADASGPGLELNGTSLTWNISDLTVQSTGGATSVLLLNAGTTNFLSAGTISITSAGGKALGATGTNMGAGSVFDDLTSTGSNAGGVSLINTTGTTTLGNGAGTDLDLTTTSGTTAALEIVGGNVSVPGGGTANLNATGGPAADITNTNGSFDLDTVTSLNSASDGINIDGIGAGSFTATGGSIGGATDRSLDLNGGSGTVTYPGPLNNGSGAIAIDITGRTGGAVTLAGAISDTADGGVSGGGLNMTGNTGGSTTLSNGTKQFNTGTTNGVIFNNSDGHTLTLSGGGLDIDTTSGKGLEADTSGTITVSGASNTIDVTAGPNRAININNTDIVTGATFEHISSNASSTNGISLTNTGTAAGNAGLTITGSSAGTCGGQVSASTGGTPGTVTGAASGDCTGGTIQASTGAGVVLSSTKNPSLTRLWVKTSGDDGMRVTSVPSLTLSDTLIETSGNASGENGLEISQATGSYSITDTKVTGSAESNAFVDQTSGTLTAFTVTSSQFTSTTAAAPGADGLRLTPGGTSNVTASITNSFFSNNRDDQFQVAPTGSAISSITFSNNTLSDTTATTLGGGITINPATNTDTTAVVNGNDIVHPVLSALNFNLNTDSTVGSELHATAIGNFIGNAGDNGSGAETADGIQVTGNGAGHIFALIKDNDVRQYSNPYGIHVFSRDGDGFVDATIQGNTVTEINPAGFVLDGIRIEAGSVSGDASTVCADVGGGSAALKNHVTTGGNEGGGGVDIRMRVRIDATIKLPGYVGPANNGGLQVETYIAGRNDTTTQLATTASTVGYLAGTCALP